MITIYSNHSKTDITLEDSTQKLSIKNNIIQLKLTTETSLQQYKTLEIDLNDIEQDTRYSVLSYKEGYSPFLLNEYKDDTLNLENSAITFFKSCAGDIDIHLSFDTEILDEESDEYTLHDPIDHFRTELMNKYSSYKEKQNKIFLHSVIKDQIDNKTSLSYIDAQLELISDLVLKIVNQYPVNNIDSQYVANIQKAISDTSLLNIKSADKMINELTMNKATVRNIQKAYYEEKTKFISTSQQQENNDGN